MTEDDRQPCGPVGLGSVLYSNSRLAGNTKRVGHAGLGGPGRLEGSGRGPGVPGGTVAGDPGPSAARGAPGCSKMLLISSPASWRSVQGSFLFLSPLPYRARLVSPSPDLPFLVSRFRDPTSLLACLHCGLNQSQSGPEAPRVLCPAPAPRVFPDSCLPLIFPSSPLHRGPLPSPPAL